jgi:molybdopterin converting factor subunit 1
MQRMYVRVLFFGQLREIVGAPEERAELSEGARIEDLFERYGRRYPKLAEFRASIAPSLNQEYADWRALLSSGDEVAFLPPVSGG